MTHRHGRTPAITVDELFRFRWTNGMPTTEMARLYRVTVPTIRNTAKSAGLGPRASARHEDILADPRFRQMWRDGFPAEEIAAALGCSASFVRDKAREAGLPVRGRGKVKPGGCVKVAEQASEPPAEASTAFGGITAELVAQLRAIKPSKGAYAELTRVGRAHGLTYRQTEQRWHHVRGRR